MGMVAQAQALALEAQSVDDSPLAALRERLARQVRISANVTGDFGNVTDWGLGAGLRG